MKTPRWVLLALVLAAPVLADDPTPTVMPKQGNHGSTDSAAMTYGKFVLDPTSIAAGAVGAFPVTIPGLQMGDMIILYPPLSLLLTPMAANWFISTNNTLGVLLFNVGAAPADGASGEWEYVWWDRTAPGQPVATPILAPTNMPTSTSTPTFTLTPTRTNTRTPTRTPTNTP